MNEIMKAHLGDLTVVSGGDYSRVEVITGDLYLKYAVGFYFPKLREVQGNLSVWDTRELSMPSLVTVRGNCSLGLSKKVSIPNIETVGKYLHLYPPGAVCLNKLVRVGHELRIGGGRSSEEASQFSLRNLKEVGR